LISSEGLTIALQDITHSFQHWLCYCNLTRNGSKLVYSTYNLPYMKKTILSLSFFLAIFCLSSTTRVAAQVSVGLSITVAPPVIPVYTQPACPVDGYLWVPGYWNYGDDGYYWVPGYWAAPPTVGFLWTPGYWGFAGGYYGWHGGYWGPHIGFYGGVNYGFGYGGVGYVGGGWEGGHFRYNTAVTNVNTTVVHNTYVNRTVVNNVTVNNRVSYNGGAGGIQARPSAQEQVAMNEHHVSATAVQTQHEQVARQDRNAYANVNHGRPATAAVARPMTSAAHLGAATAHNNATVHNNTPAVNRNAAVSRPANTTVNHPNTAVTHPQPQVRATHAQPQMHTTQPRTQVAHPAPHAAPRAAPREGGGGGEHRPR
jgi:hypothetical protein